MMIVEKIAGTYPGVPAIFETSHEREVPRKEVPGY